MAAHSVCSSSEDALTLILRDRVLTTEEAALKRLRRDWTLRPPFEQRIQANSYKWSNKTSEVGVCRRGTEEDEAMNSPGPINRR